MFVVCMSDTSALVSNHKLGANSAFILFVSRQKPLRMIKEQQPALQLWHYKEKRQPGSTNSAKLLALIILLSQELHSLTLLMERDRGVSFIEQGIYDRSVILITGWP